MIVVIRRADVVASQDLLLFAQQGTDVKNYCITMLVVFPLNLLVVYVCGAGLAMTMIWWAMHA